MPVVVQQRAHCPRRSSMCDPAHVTSLLHPPQSLQSFSSTVPEDYTRIPASASPLDSPCAMADRALLDVSGLPKQIRDQLAELDLELSEGDITQKGYEKKRTKLLAPFFIQAPPVAPAPRNNVQAAAPSSSGHAPSAANASRYRERRSKRSHRSGGTRDDRYRSDIHTEAVQAALAKHKEEKIALPMPTKRRSTYVQSPINTRTPPDSSSGSEDDSSSRRQSTGAAPMPQVPPTLQTSFQASPSLQSPEAWINRTVQGSSTSSSASSTMSHGEAKPAQAQPQYKPQYQPLYQPNAETNAATVSNLLAHSRIAAAENSAPPPDVTAVVPPATTRGPRVDRPSNATVRGMNRIQSRSSMMETADGVPVNSRVSTKIQQLLNTLKRPKRPPLSEFFTDDSEEIVEVPQPDPNTPKPEGRQIIPVKGEPLGVVSNWPPALQAALARWGATQGKSPALTALDITGKPLYTLTYGKLWSRSVKLAYTLLHKLGTKNEQILKPGDRVALVYPNSDPGMFWVAFYGCLLAEVIPVPIEVPLSRKVSEYTAAY
uniref:DMAP1-binding domain-containing protein n=1 Tax=Knipowitschia caucasica TaxID=637954 RepID=A0AAV2M526_KNICA